MMAVDILWLGQTFTESEVAKNIAISPAANRWQEGCALALKAVGCNVIAVGHVPVKIGSPAWMNGCSDTSKELNGLTQYRVKYVNIPSLRNYSLTAGYKKKCESLKSAGHKFNVVISYNSYDWNQKTAKYLRAKYNVPWIAIVADGEAPLDADAYIFLSYSHFNSTAVSRPKILVQGGVDITKVVASRQPKINNKETIRVLYAGSICKVSGADLILSSCEIAKKYGIQFSIFGKTDSSAKKSVQAAYGNDACAALKGFVDNDVLENEFLASDVFINPRPSDIAENRLNFPSKLLEYLRFPKPIVSTWTDSLTPEWKPLLTIPNSETAPALIDSILRAHDMTTAQFNEWNENRMKFLAENSWLSIAQKLKKFIHLQI